MKLYWDLSINVFPMKELKARNEIVNNDNNQGELGKTSKLSRVIFSLEILINKIPYYTIMIFIKVRKSKRANTTT